MNTRYTKQAGFTLIELMIVVAITGVLASIAVPAFIKYVRRSYSTEAILNVEKLAQGAMAYYMAEHADAAGAILPRQFPFYDLNHTGGRELPLHEWRCASGTNYYTGGGKFAPSTWQAMMTDNVMHPFFEAVNFGIDDPFYYSVFAVNAPGEIIVGALSDLNCNGIPGYFERIVKVDADNNLMASAVYQAAPLE